MDWKLRWSPRAASQLEKICNYISLDSPTYASIFAKRILSTIETIVDFPYSGRMVPEYRQEELREKILGNYRIVYRLKNNYIEIATISHGARLLENAFKD